MATPEHIRQQKYRERRAARLDHADRMEAALLAICQKLEGRTGALAGEIFNMALVAMTSEERKAPE